MVLKHWNARCPTPPHLVHVPRGFSCSPLSPCSVASMLRRCAIASGAAGPLALFIAARWASSRARVSSCDACGSNPIVSDCLPHKKNHVNIPFCDPCVTSHLSNHLPIRRVCAVPRLRPAGCAESVGSFAQLCFFVSHRNRSRLKDFSFLFSTNVMTRITRTVCVAALLCAATAAAVAFDSPFVPQYHPASVRETNQSCCADRALCCEFVSHILHVPQTLTNTNVPQQWFWQYMLRDGFHQALLH